MESPKRGGADALSRLEQLEASPEKHHVYNALRIIEAAFPEKPRIGEGKRLRDDPFRFGQEAELNFPPSTVAQVERPKGDRPGRLTNRFFGLFGPNGPLPLHLTEFARGRMRNHRDPTFVAFANMVTHRLFTLFFRAWRAGQPAPSFDRANDDALAEKVAAIAGLRGGALKERDEMPDLAKLHFAGLLGQGAKNASGLRAMVAGFFGATVEVEEFVGQWLTLEPEDRWQMGQPAALGRTASVGERVWSRGSKFRLRIGPLSFADYQRLLPSGASLARLSAIVRNYAGDTLDWDVNLILRREEVPAPILGQSVMLGHTSWVGTRPGEEDAGDLYLEPNAQALAAPRGT